MIKQLTQIQSDAMFEAGMKLANVGLSFQDCADIEKYINRKQFQKPVIVDHMSLISNDKVDPEVIKKFKEIQRSIPITMVMDDEELRKKYPANIEGSEEFNEAQKELTIWERIERAVIKFQESKNDPDEIMLSNYDYELLGKAVAYEYLEIGGCELKVYGGLKSNSFVGSEHTDLKVEI